MEQIPQPALWSSMVSSNDQIQPEARGQGNPLMQSKRSASQALHSRVEKCREWVWRGTLKLSSSSDYVRGTVLNCHVGHLI